MHDTDYQRNHLVTSDPRFVDALIGAYNTDGGIIGELRYVAAKVTAGATAVSAT